MNSPEERSLRKHFEDLRAADQSSVPPFPATLVAERRRPMLLWAIAAAAVLAVCLALPLAFRPRTEPLPSVENIAIATWSSPTAFLLETPGRKLFRETPRISAPALLAIPARKEPSK